MKKTCQYDLKKQATNLEKIFVNHIPDKDLYPENTKTIKVNSKKKKKESNQIRKWAKNIKRISPKKIYR